MPTSTYVALATTTLGGTDASVTFASIPTSGYRDLILVIGGNATGNENAELRFNGDSGSNYTNVRALGSSVIVSDSATATSTQRAARIGSGQSTVIMQIMDYSATDKHKTVLARSMQSTDAVHMGAARWANTSAITSVEVFVSANAYATGTVMSLYGIAS